MSQNINLGKTQITDKIRVSSAAIFYESAFFGDYYQLETWIFSDDERQKSRMVIHGTVPVVTEYERAWVGKIHAQIARNMLNKFRYANG